MEASPSERTERTHKRLQGTLKQPSFVLHSYSVVLFGAVPRVIVKKFPSHFAAISEGFRVVFGKYQELYQKAGKKIDDSQ